jgi:hypothetical protein
MAAEERGAYTAMHKYYHNNFSRISKTALSKRANKAGMLYINVIFEFKYLGVSSVHICFLNVPICNRLKTSFSSV